MISDYKKFISEMTDDKAIEYLYQNAYVDLKIADYIANRLKENKATTD